jgi:hypothetical protein
MNKPREGALVQFTEEELSGAGIVQTGLEPHEYINPYHSQSDYFEGDKDE